MILTAGENVYSVEVERVLNDHEDVRYAAVFGVPNAMLGELVKAVVVLEPGRSRPAKVLRSFCATRLADYKCPREIEFLAEADMPMTGSGKVAKNELKKREARRSSSDFSSFAADISSEPATPPFGQSLLEIQWKRSPISWATTSLENKVVAIYCRRETEDLAQTNALLEERGAEVIVISDLAAHGCNEYISRADHLVFFHSTEQHKEEREYFALRTDLLQHFLIFSQALVSAQATGKAWLFTRGAAVEIGNSSSDGARLAPVMQALWGFARVLGAEQPKLSPSIVDLCPHETNAMEVAKIVAAELSSTSASESAWRGRVRFTPQLTPSTLSEATSAGVRRFE